MRIVVENPETKENYNLRNQFTKRQDNMTCVPTKLPERLALLKGPRGLLTLKVFNENYNS